MHKLISVVTLFSLLFFSSSVPLYSQNTQQQTEKVRAKIRKLGLGERVKVKVKLYSEATLQGYVSQASENDFVVVDKTGQSHIVKYADVKSVGGKNFSTGAKIAVGIGIGVGATILALLLIIAALDD